MSVAVNKKILEAVHFICAKAEGLPLGATRLNKILWFTEKERFLHNLKPMLGLRFIKGPYGPMPPIIEDVCNELAASGLISIETVNYGAYTYTDIRSLCSPKPCLLSEEEQQFLQNLTWEICTEHSARSISDLTHNTIYYMLSLGEEYPVDLALVEKARPATDEEIASLMQEDDHVC